MRTIAHISDLHFGTEDPGVMEGLLEDLSDLKPHVVAISGDLTQRARKNQFAAAQAFLKNLPYPHIVIPGNHDIPLYDIAHRFLSPLERYKQYISSELNPIYRDEEMILLAMNTARSKTFVNGRISHSQMELIHKTFGSEQNVFKIVMTHHPFVPPSQRPRAAVVGRGIQALRTIESSGVEMLLSGHFHLGYSGDVRSHYSRIERSLISVQAGTAISRRLRGEPNSYNRIRIAPAKITIEVQIWNGKKFEPATHTTYAKINEAWVKKEDLG